MYDVKPLPPDPYAYITSHGMRVCTTGVWQFISTEEWQEQTLAI